MNHRYAGRKPLVALAMLLAILAGCRSTSFQQILERQTEILDRLDDIERSVRFASATVKEQERASQLRWEEFVQSLGQPIDRSFYIQLAGLGVSLVTALVLIRTVP